MNACPIVKRKGISIYDVKNKTKIDGTFRLRYGTIFGIASQIGGLDFQPGQKKACEQAKQMKAAGE